MLRLSNPTLSTLPLSGRWRTDQILILIRQAPSATTTVKSRLRDALARLYLRLGTTLEARNRSLHRMLVDVLRLSIGALMAPSGRAGPGC